MKKILLLSAIILNTLLLSAQGIYQIWGMTPRGGKDDKGVIFNTNGEGDNFKLIHNLGSDISISNGQNLIFKDGKLFGTAYGWGEGALFEWDPVTKKYVDFVFMDWWNGQSPECQLVLKGNNFYGITRGGGVNGAGVIFEWDPDAHIYTKKVDLGGANGVLPMAGADLVEYAGKFYGVTFRGGSKDSGVIFEWDPGTNVFIKKIDFNYPNGGLPIGALALNNGKFYGVTWGGGSGFGVIFEWDPVTNIYVKKYEFTLDKGVLPTTMTKYNGKFYGITVAGGLYNRGVIYEWDPLTNLFTTKINLDSIDGSRGWSKLILGGGNFYGMTSDGGKFNAGVIFQWDPITNIYTKKKDFQVSDGAYPQFNYPTYTPALVSNGLVGSCLTFAPVTINEANNNKWIPIVDSENNAVAEIKANGNNLGVVTASMYINSCKVREDGTQRLYMDRNITLTSQFPQKSAVDIRLYVRRSELTALKNAHNSFGQTAGINSINDVGIYKVKGNCRIVIGAVSNLLTTTGASWGNDYVLSASLNSLSTFCFASKNPCAPPLISQVSAAPGSLIQVDHQLKDVLINYDAKGNCGQVTTTLAVTSNEPVTGTGNGDLSPDWLVVDNHHVQLRAERSDQGTGRIYTITVTAKNAVGTTCKKTVKVTVPLQLPVSAKSNSTNENLFAVDTKLSCTVLPNPSAGNFNLQIQTSSTERIDLSLLDLSGRVISKWNGINDKSFRFGNQLKPGVYILNVTQGQQQQILKLIKQ